MSCSTVYRPWNGRSWTSSSSCSWSSSARFAGDTVQGSPRARRLRRAVECGESSCSRSWVARGASAAVSSGRREATLRSGERCARTPSRQVVTVGIVSVVSARPQVLEAGTTHVKVGSCVPHHGKTRRLPRVTCQAMVMGPTAVRGMTCSRSVGWRASPSRLRSSRRSAAVAGASGRRFPAEVPRRR